MHACMPKMYIALNAPNKRIKLMMMKIASNSRARREGRKGGRLRVGMEELEGRRRGMMTTGNGATESAICCWLDYWCKRGWAGIGHERFKNGGNILGRHSGRGYIGNRRSPMLYTRCHLDTLLITSYYTQENGGRIMILDHTGKVLTNFWYNLADI